MHKTTTTDDFSSVFIVSSVTTSGMEIANNIGRNITMKTIIPKEIIESKIYLIRCQRVMLDHDLAALYGVKTKNLNKAVTRNLDRFPKDFMFQLNNNEFENLRFQFGTSKQGGRRYNPYVFTEQGISMLSSVLRSEKAVQVNIAIIRTFVKLRQILSKNKRIANKVKELEDKFGKHDEEIQVIFNIIKQMLTPSEKPKQKIGFQPTKNII